MGTVARYAIAETIAIAVLLRIARTFVRSRWTKKAAAVFPVLAFTSLVLAAIVANAAGKPDWLYLPAVGPLMVITAVTAVTVARGPRPD